MTWMKTALYLSTIPLSIGLAIMSSIPGQVKAQSLQTSVINKSSQPLLISLNFKTPNRGAPSSTAGGATRGSCDKLSKQITPILPKEKLGLTLSERPTFFVNLPKAAAKNAEFLLLATENDISTEVVYEATVNLPEQPGIMAYTLPDNAPALETGKRYRWFLSVPCNADESEAKATVDGWVERTESNVTLSKQLETAEVSKRPEVYAQAGIWYETLASLVQQRCNNPNDAKIKEDWRKLFQYAGLSNLASESLVNSCKVDK
jgi:Domain of Unknown Function (DUF928)